MTEYSKTLWAVDLLSNVDAEGKEHGKDRMLQFCAYIHDGHPNGARSAAMSALSRRAEMHVHYDHVHEFTVKALPVGVDAALLPGQLNSILGKTEYIAFLERAHDLICDCHTAKDRESGERPSLGEIESLLDAIIESRLGTGAPRLLNFDFLGVSKPDDPS